MFVTNAEIINKIIRYYNAYCEYKFLIPERHQEQGHSTVICVPVKCIDCTCPFITQFRHSVSPYYVVLEIIIFNDELALDIFKLKTDFKIIIINIRALSYQTSYI